MSLSSDVAEHNLSRQSVSNSIFRWLGIQLKPPGGLKEKAMAVSAATTLLVCGFAANRGLEMASDYLFPDATLDQVITAQGVISDKVSRIEALSETISKQVGNTESYLGKSLQLDTEILISEIKGLQAEVLHVAELGGNAAKSFADAKRSELLAQKFSKQSDFVLPSAQGATVCPERYIFGFQKATNSTISATLSGDGTQITQALQPGSSLTLNKSAGGFVQVGYQGRYGTENNPLYGFSVICQN